jgi:hypothetical protein
MRTVLFNTILLATFFATLLGHAQAQEPLEPATKTGSQKNGVKADNNGRVGVKDTLPPVITAKDTMIPVISWRQKVSNDTAMKVMSEVKGKLGAAAAVRLEKARNLKTFKRVLSAIAKKCPHCAYAKALSSQLASKTKPAANK